MRTRVPGYPYPGTKQCSHLPGYPGTRGTRVPGYRIPVPGYPGTRLFTISSTADLYWLHELVRGVCCLRANFGGRLSPKTQQLFSTPSDLFPAKFCLKGYPKSQSGRLLRSVLLVYLCRDFLSWLLRVFLVLVWGIALRAGFGAGSGGSPGFYAEYRHTLNEMLHKFSTEKRGGEESPPPDELDTSPALWAQLDVQNLHAASLGQAMHPFLLQTAALRTKHPVLA
eukprot:2229866-Rhodomonas_salina.1